MRGFSKNNNPVIVPLNSSIRPQDIGYTDEPTELDYLHINLLYCGGEDQSFFARCVHVLYLESIVVLYIIIWMAQMSKRMPRAIIAH